MEVNLGYVNYLSGGPARIILPSFNTMNTSGGGTPSVPAKLNVGPYPAMMIMLSGGPLSGPLADITVEPRVIITIRATKIDKAIRFITCLPHLRAPF